MKSSKEVISIRKEEPDNFIRPEKRCTLNTKPDPLDIDLHRTAVIVVDMQNAFVSKGGMFDISGMDISGAKDVIEKNRNIRLYPSFSTTNKLITTIILGS